MTPKERLRMGVAAALLLVGFLLHWFPTRGYSERRYIVDAGSCKMDVNIIQRGSGEVAPSENAVVLFHGLAANKIIMTYLAHAFANEGLRVIVPDLPGHGRSPGPFYPAHAEECATSLVRGMIARGLITPSHTILAGHSMGGAIALRVASHVRVPGVIAFSPAPMKADHGLSPEMLLFSNPPPAPPNTLILAGQFEPGGLLGDARDLAFSSSDSSAKFEIIPLDTHVSMMFSPTVAAKAQDWAAQVLHLPSSATVPSRLGYLGSILGLAGILLLAGPFLRELLGKKVRQESSQGASLSALRLFLEFAAVSLIAVVILRFFVPLRTLRLFEGDYLASFFLISGLLLLALHPRRALRNWRVDPPIALSALFGGVILHLLVTGWLEITITGAWMNAQRWLRWPISFLAVFLFFYLLETLVGPALDTNYRRFMLLSLGLIGLSWLSLVFAGFYLHSGQILPVLLVPFFATFFFFQRMGAFLVRRLSGSASAAALFGAIIFAGFCMVVFPVS